MVVGGEWLDNARWLIDNATRVRPKPDFTFFRTPYTAMDHKDPAWPAIALPISGKAEFECPESHLLALVDSLPHVSRVLAIGWRGAEDHFLKVLAGNLNPSVRWFIVGRDSSDAQDIAGNIGKAGFGGNREVPNAGFTESLTKHVIRKFLAKK
jgi:hypothetical protein